jgi:hypothetical protein
MGCNLLTLYVFCVQLGLTIFADMSLDEYKTHALGYRCEWGSFIAQGPSPFLMIILHEAAAHY